VKHNKKKQKFLYHGNKFLNFQEYIYTKNWGGGGAKSKRRKNKKGLKKLRVSSESHPG
jgi:hypothetical protein